MALSSYRKTHGEADEPTFYLIELIIWELFLFQTILRHANWGCWYNSPKVNHFEGLLSPHHIVRLRMCNARENESEK